MQTLDYEKLSPLGKLCANVWLTAKGLALGAAFVLTVVLAGLTLIAALPFWLSFKILDWIEART